MAQLNTSRIDNNTTVDNIDDRMRALEADVAAILGITPDVVIANPAFAIIAAGLTALFLQTSGDPTIAGQVTRNGASMMFHNGSAAVAVALMNHAVFQSNSNAFGVRRWQTTVPADGDYSEGDLTFVY